MLSGAGYQPIYEVDAPKIARALLARKRFQPASGEDARDAARYRWLRDPTVDPGLVIDKRVRHVDNAGKTVSIDFEYRSSADLDVAIDAAMQQEGK